MVQYDNSIDQIVSSKTTILVSSFIEKIKPSTGIQFNLAWNFGGFLAEVPKRLGKNEALDAAAEALLSIYMRFGEQKSQNNVKLLMRYGKALETLRLTLNDPIKAQSSETLCAVMLLLLCQSYIGTSDPITSHSAGAARILKVRGYYDPTDEFESQILLALRGPVVVEALYNPDIQFSDEEWQHLVFNHLDGSQPEGEMMQHLARVPNLLRRGHSLLHTSPLDVVGLYQLDNDIALLRDEFQHTIKQLYERLEDFNETPKIVFGTPEIAAMLHCIYLRGYGFGLTINLALDCIRVALGISAEIPLILKRLQDSSAEIVDLARLASPYRPLGSGSFTVGLAVASVAASDPLTRESALVWLLKYYQDYQDPPSSYEQCGQVWTKRHLFLGQSPPHLIDDHNKTFDLSFQVV